ncbi:MAG: hypothetical protein IJ735_03190 [Clostridia bacterium]|nr:hypothetical protein [Clostridia bacterium]
MKAFLKTKACKITAIVLASIVGATGVFLATVATVFAVRKTAVVVIPGLLCSSIQDTETEDIYYDPLNTDEYGYSFDDFFGDRMMATVTDIAVHSGVVDKLFAVLNEEEGNFLDKFALDETGAPVYPSAAIQWDHEGYARYGAMTVMKKPYDYYADLYRNKKNYDVFVFQYDWRRDNRIAAEALVKVTEGYDDVITVAHSMGNIVVSLALAQSESFRKKVILNCSYAAPYFGSYNALDILEDGERTVGGILDQARSFLNDHPALKFLFKNILDKADAICYEKVLPYFRGMPGIVQLLPTIDLVCPDGEHSNLQVNGEYITTEEQLTDYYESCFWAHEGEDLDAPVRSWVADLSDYWAAFYVNGVHASKLVNTYYFAGYDRNTTESVTVEKSPEGEILSFRTSSGEGDGTVPYLSATLGGSVSDRVLRTEGYAHTELGTAIAEDLVTAQTATATASIDNPYKVLAIKAKYPRKTSP